MKMTVSVSIDEFEHGCRLRVAFAGVEEISMSSAIMPREECDGRLLALSQAMAKIVTVALLEGNAASLKISRG